MNRRTQLYLVASIAISLLVPLAGEAGIRRYDSFSRRNFDKKADLNLADLMNPDDVMLRKPTAVRATADSPAAAEKAAAEKAAAEKAAAEKAAAEKAAAEKAAAEKAAAEKAAAEKAAAEKAAAEKAAAEAAARAAAAERVRKEVEEKAAADALRREAELKSLREQVAAEKAAREKADIARAEAEQKVEKAEKTISRLKNPDPDERPRPKKLAAPEVADDVVVAVPSGEPVTPAAAAQDSRSHSKKKTSGREAVITAERTDYDRKEGIILFDRNVYVDDEQYQLHADRIFLFLDGTNDLKRLVALGNVAITNEEKNASCARAVYTRSTSKIVMYGADGNPASLFQGGKKGSTVRGERITFWLNSEQVEIEKPVVTVPGGSFGGGDAKNIFKNMK